jgi:hypothetical protein
MKKEKIMYSDVYGEKVRLIYEKHNRPYIECTRCGKDLTSFYVVQGLETGIEHAYLGRECIKHLG